MVLSAEVAVRKCSIKKVPLRIPENSLEDRWKRCFPVNFFKKFKNIFFTEDLRVTASVSDKILCIPSFYKKIVLEIVFSKNS